MSSKVGAIMSGTRAGALRWRQGKHGRERRGVAAVLAMLYLVLFASLALGFYAQVTTSAQLAGNERRAAEAQVAAESGARFLQFQLNAVNIAGGLTSDQAFSQLYSQLKSRLEGTGNLGGKLLGYTAAAGGNPAEIRIPDGATDYIALRTGGPKFRAVITDAAPKIKVKFIGLSGSPTGGAGISRAFELQFQRAPRHYALIGINGVTMSGSAFTDSYDASKGPYAAATARSMGSIASNGNVTLSNTARVSGDVRYGSASTLSVAPTATITGMSLPMTSTAAYPSVTLPPAGTYTDLGDVNNSGGPPQYVSGGTYVINNLTLSGTAKIIWQGPVKLYIKSSYNVSGSVEITTYQNLPVNRQLYFLPTCTTATWSGTNVCVGDLYAPDTDFTVSGGVQKMGRIVAKSINNSSTGGMHYDESLPAPNNQISFTPVADSYLEVRP